MLREKSAMSTESIGTNHGHQPTETPPLVNITPSGRAGMKLYEREIATYLRELPRLLEQGQAWRHALIKGDEVLGIWEAQGDAIQAGCEQFGLDPIFVKCIDPRDPQRFDLLRRQLEKSEKSPWPS
jgi:hypothetical protein